MKSYLEKDIILNLIAIEDFKNTEFKSAYPQYSKMNCRIVHPQMDQIQKYYQEAYLTFIPSKWSEGTSLSAIEAMSTGCPVIASDVGGLGNIILPGFNGYIIPPSIDEFVAKTEELLNNVEKRNELSRNCRLMNQIFGKRRWEEQILKAISFLIN